MTRAVRRRQLQRGAWTRSSVSLLLSLGACAMERGGLTILSEAPYQSDAAPAAVARDPVGRAETDLPTDAGSGSPEPWLDAGGPSPLLDAAGLYPLLDAGEPTDGSPTTADQCPDDADKTEPGLCGCDTPDTDRDRDSTPDCNDDCRFDRNKVTPGLCGCGEDERDGDGDGVPDCVDTCSEDPNKVEEGVCGCGEPDPDQNAIGNLLGCLDKPGKPKRRR